MKLVQSQRRPWLRAAAGYQVDLHPSPGGVTVCNSIALSHPARRGCPVLAPDASGLTALELAVQQQHEDVARWLEHAVVDEFQRGDTCRRRALD